jgi:hypothetical protein
MSKSKSSLLLIGLVAFPLWAKPVALVTEVTGSVFSITSEGKTVALKVDSHVEDKSELMLEEGASITLNDYYDATYHLIGGSHLKFFDKSVQLKRGKVWVESGATRTPLALTTANGSVNFWKGEFIASFDQGTSRSQFLVVNGEVEVSNVLDTNMKYTVAAGTFSLIDPEIENGVPRAPTKVGLASLNQSLGEFKALPAKMKTESTPARTIASVETMAPVKAPKGEIIFMSQGRLPASVQGGAHSYFKKKVAKKKPVEETAVVVRFFGTSWTQAKPYVATTMENKSVQERIPASVRPSPVTAVAKPLPQNMEMENEFSSSLKIQEETQPKYSKELDGLIRDLKSY